MHANQQNREIVKTIVLLSGNLNLEVVAEGIETAEQAEYLRGLDCDYGQGYLFSRPVEAEMAGRLLRDDFSRPIPSERPDSAVIELINEATH
jgi:EAL domain-containing protein (putative c-di-GMP-specific phosphodiesterase class I)